MRKLISFITLCLFVFATATSAQTVVPNVMPASAGARVGVAAGVKGSVQLARDGGVGQVVSSGAEIFLGDKISTDAKGGLQILLLDQTTFTIGANSAIVVDQFVYDPSTDAGKVSVRVVEGTFRFITGKIAHKNPENMQVDLPNGTIGVRGTMVMGRVDGAKSLAILTGPGDKNNTGSRHGAIIVGGKGGDESKSVRISKTGFGTEIEGGGAPKMPFLVPQALLDQMTSELSPKSGDDKGGEGKEGDSGESASEQAGQDAVDTGGDLGASGSLGDLSSGLGDKATETAQKIASDANKVLDGTTTIAQLGSITTGEALFIKTGLQLYDSTQSPVGTYGVHIHVNYGDRTIGGVDSYISGTATNSYAGNSPFTFNLFGAPKNIDTDGSGGSAIYSFSNISATGACSADCLVNATMTLSNSGGEIAQNLSVVATFTDAGHPGATVHVNDSIQA